jgi:outer membrane biogenesis lipoprotein LolB
MKKLRLSAAVLALLAVGILTGCSETSTKSPDVSDAFANHWIKQASKTSPSVRIATRAS